MDCLAHFLSVRQKVADSILGQSDLVDALLIAILADGHILVEGAPGLAKTKAIKTLTNHVEGNFHRIQFTPDLLPADITGTDIYRPETGTFEFQKGPLFHNLILADEINRAPAKVQSALLEAMAENQISIGMKTYQLPDLFMVLATQNPLEQEGTYNLPEAQLDRFLLHILVGYPEKNTEASILKLVREELLSTQAKSASTPKSDINISQDIIFKARREVLSLHMAEPIETYIVDLIQCTRDSSDIDPQISSWLEYGASPRGTLALDRTSRAYAWLQGRDFVTPDDVKAVVHNVLRHRLILSFEAEANGITKDTVIDKLLEVVAIG